MKTTLARTCAILATLAALAGCVVYEPSPYAPHPAATFDRSWNAATGALADQGMQVVNQDRATGVIEGRRGGITVKARVFTRADGSVQVEFNTSPFADLSLWDGPSATASIGARVKLSKTMALSGAVGTGLTEASSDLVVSAGVDMTF